MEIVTLKVIAIELLKANPDCKLSGSLALHLMGYRLRREPCDIDIYVPPKKAFKPIEGMVIQSDDESMDDYEEQQFVRDSYDYKGTKIDVFYHADETERELYPQEAMGFNCVQWFDILKLKLSHAFDDSEKHALDLIFMLSAQLK